MPITPQQTFTPLTQSEFGKLSYDVVAEVLAIRRELGRFFDEKHYKRALSLRRPDVSLEVPIHVSHADFRKSYFLDVVVGMGGVFEFKAAESLNARHKAQLLHYLMLAELSHGTLINVRSEALGHEFTNNSLTLKDRLQFRFTAEAWNPKMKGADQFHAVLSDILSDWGTCLDLGLYEEAITHFCGGDASAVRPACVSFDGHDIGFQNMRFVTEKTAFKLTSFGNTTSQQRFASHAQRLVNHIDIECLLWANIGRREVTLVTLMPES